MLGRSLKPPYTIGGFRFFKNKTPPPSHFVHRGLFILVQLYKVATVWIYCIFASIFVAMNRQQVQKSVNKQLTKAFIAMLSGEKVSISEAASAMQIKPDSLHARISRNAISLADILIISKLKGRRLRLQDGKLHFYIE